jgi:serine/threonine protein kinase
MSRDEELVAAALPLFDVQGELGRGAWGIVLAGRHRSLGRDVAIKQLPQAFSADPAVQSRFRAEARMLAALEHPHIVPIYDFVEHEGMCLLVMERLTGGTVGHRARAGGFTLQTSSGVVIAACAALHYAHAHGVLHRDVKPENMMFSSKGILKVTDFGIAKVVGGAASVATRAGDVLGTPAYMAPEQAMGGELGPATDVYAVGTVLYQLLSGRLPFPEDSNPITTLYKHVHEDPLPLLQVAPQVPQRLADVTARALHRDPTQRYPNAEHLAVALAGAGADLWGPGWLTRSDMAISASGPVLDAAMARSSPAPAAATPAVREAPTAESPQMAAAAAPANLVPLNVLSPDLAASVPPRSNRSGVVTAIGLIAAIIVVAIIGVIRLTHHPAPTTLESNVPVDGRVAFSDTAVDLQVGDKVTIAATGTVWADTNKTLVASPAGVPNRPDLLKYNVVPNVQHSGLIGRVGSGKPFNVAAKLVFTAQQAGRLFLGINDINLGDNSGAFRATVTVVRK